MGYTALYRKFRPDSFASVKGQDHIVKTLKNQIMADRIGHAYLFCGTRGTGKTTVAKILAKAVNCEHPVDGNPCGECETCKAIAAGTSMNVIEIDAASNNGVDNIREIREEVAYSPTTGKYKVYIIDEVHMLSIGAFNALLKTLEEPPSYVIFILATTEAHKIPITILSRCQRYDFKRISINTISSRLMELMEKENVEVEERAIRYIAKKADGSMRDALSLLDQCIAFYLGQKLTYDHVLDVLGAVDTEVFSRFLREILKNDVAQVMKHLEELVMQGRELGQFVSDFTWYLRNLLLLKSSEELEEVLDVSSDNLVLLKEEAGMVREDTLIRFIRVFSELSGQMKFSGSKRVLLEVALIKLCRPQMETDEVSLLERIRMLEKKLESGMIAVRQTPPGQRMQVPEPGTGEDAFFGGLDIPGGQDGASGMDALSFEEKAAPEDLQRVMSMWPSIVAQTTGRFKMTLISAVPKYNAAGEDNRLFVVFSDFMGERYANDPEAKRQLETIISGRLGKEVEVKMVLPDEEHLAPGRLAKINVSDGLSKIHADIEIEE
ncbi:MAG: DNA polymerase III subunit gamma/tau [Lachnospiraceae bacterium]|nr:DNA polymerase III subunit gamma/tau [Lachnospiraceae bacterium]